MPIEMGDTVHLSDEGFASLTYGWRGNTNINLPSSPEEFSGTVVYIEYRSYWDEDDIEIIDFTQIESIGIELNSFIFYRDVEDSPAPQYMEYEPEFWVLKSKKEQITKSGFKKFILNSEG